MKKSEWFLGMAKISSVTVAVSYVFYGTVYVMPLLFPIWIIYFRDWFYDMSVRKEQEFREQFRDSIQILSSVLKAGYSVENAVKETARDISPMYPADARIRKEFSKMVYQLSVNMTAVSVLEKFAERMNQEDVSDFVYIFSISKKTGGDSIAIIRKSVRIISEKIETEKEIQTIIAARKMEFNIMCVVPFGIILYMKAAFDDFMSVLYGNAAGITVMTICLMIYMAAYIVGRKIVYIPI